MKRQGLTLVEIIVSIAIFSIIMLAISGTIVSGLQLRRNNTLESQALIYAASVLEQYKSFWADQQNYRCYNPDDRFGLTTAQCQKDPGRVFWPTILPAFGALQDDLIYIDIICIQRDGTPIGKAACTTEGFIPELRRVSVTIKDTKGVTRASLTTEIGNPK